MELLKSKKFKHLENENIALRSEILSLGTSIEMLTEENQNLRQKLESPPPVTQNQRGAGRKKTCSQEDISFVKDLCTQGCKVSEIVQKLNQDTDKKWTHSQVTYIKNRYL